MKKTVLPNTDVVMSRFSFGTAGLFNAGSAKVRASLLAAAHDNGFTHFDTAPYYGFGVAERDLGEFLKSRPDVTVATKGGMYSPGGENQPLSSIFFRKVVGRIVHSVSRPTVDWSVARAENSLTESLTRLKRDYVDIYFLHEPELSLLRTDEWLRWLESERERVRWFGIAVNSHRLAPFLCTPHPLAAVVQTIDSLSHREADAVLRRGRRLQITYGYVSTAIREGVKDVPQVLAAALRRNAFGSVIVSTTKLSRLPQYAAIASDVNQGDR